MFVEEIIVGLVIGAFGSLGAPLVTHKLSKTTRFAERREESYRRILQTAADLVEASGARGRYIARAMGDDVYQAGPSRELGTAVTAADNVSSPEIRLLVAELRAASMRAVYENEQFSKKIEESGGPAKTHLEDLEPSRHADGEMRGAYNALRDRIPRETLG